MAAAVSNKDLLIVNIVVFPHETTFHEHTPPFSSLQEMRYYCSMDEFLKMDIFFFVTTIAVVVFGGILILIALRVWHILGHVERIMEIAEEETELIKDDIDDFRAEIRRRGFSIFSVGRFIRKLSCVFTSRSRRK